MEEISLTRVGDLTINYYDKPYYLTDNGFSLISIDNDIYTKYIYYILWHNHDYLDKLYQGVAQKWLIKLTLVKFVYPFHH